MNPEPAIPTSNLDPAFLEARRPLLAAIAAKVFCGIPLPEAFHPAPKPRPVQPPNRFPQGHVPANKLDLTDEERAERIKQQKRDWRIAHRSGRPPGRPRKNLITGQGPVVIGEAAS